MTVSLALRNYPRISVKRRRQIQQLAKKFGYRPNPLVSALMAGRKNSITYRMSSTLACIDGCDNVADLEALPWWNWHVQGIKERAQELGFTVDSFHARDFNFNDACLNSVLKARGIRGIVFLQASNLDKDVKLEWEYFACVKMLNWYPKARLHYVRGDDAAGLQLALEKLTCYGYTRIGLALPSSIDYILILGVFQNYQTQIHSTGRIPFFSSNYFPGENYRTHGDLHRWYCRHRPDVIIAYGFDYHEELVPFGIRVPEDVAWVKVGIYQYDRKTAGIGGTNSQAVGRAAVDVIAQQLFTNSYGLPGNHMTVMISTNEQWVDGVTVPKKRR